MLEQTIFYISASIFFWTAIIFLAASGFYLIKTLRNFREISLDLKEVSHNFKEKVDGLLGIMGGSFVLLEKIAKAYFRKKRSEKPKNQ